MDHSCQGRYRHRLRFGSARMEDIHNSIDKRSCTLPMGLFFSESSKKTKHIIYFTELCIWADLLHATGLEPLRALCYTSTMKKLIRCLPFAHRDSFTLLVGFMRFRFSVRFFSSAHPMESRGAPSLSWRRWNGIELNSYVSSDFPRRSDPDREPYVVVLNAGASSYSWYGRSSCYTLIDSFGRGSQILWWNNPRIPFFY